MKTLTEPSGSRPRVSRRKRTARPTRGKPRARVSSILVPIDFSRPSRAALDYALDLAEAFKAPVTLLHVIEVPAVPIFATYPAPVDSDMVADAKKKLAALAAKQRRARDLLQPVRVRTGSPFREIVRAAESLKMDLVVLATHGFTGVKHVLLGSTAERVVRHAPCPVLVVPAPR